MSPMRPLHIFISHPSHFLTDSEPHGDGLLAFQYISRLAKRGHQLHVAVPLMDIRQRLPPNLHLHPIASLTRPSSVNPPSLNRLEYAVRVRSLLMRLRKWVPFDLIHELNPVVAGMSLLLAGSGLPIVLGPLPPRTPAQWDDMEARSATPNRSAAQRIRDLVLLRQMRDAKLILIPTEKSLEQLSGDEAIRQKVRTLHYGVDTSRFLPEASRSSVSPSILFLANLVRRKGVFLLLDAFERMAHMQHDCVLRIAGSGPDEVELRERAAASPFKSRIEFIGKVPPARVPSILNACTVFCLPSYCEPFGMAALEAMSCGKPVIGTRTGGLGLLLDDTGSRRIKPGDADALANSLSEVLHSASLRHQMGAHNRRKVLQEFSWEIVIRKLEEMYYQLLSERVHSRYTSEETVSS